MIRARPIILSTSTWTGELKPAPDGIAHEKTREPEMHCPVSRFLWLGSFFETSPTRLPFRREGDAQLRLLTEVIHHDEFQLGRLVAHASVV